MKVITPEKPGTELASFLEKKSRRVWERLGASFLEKISKKGLFRVIWREKISFQNYRILGTELASFLEKKSRRLFYAKLTPTAVLTVIDQSEPSS